MLKLSLVVAFCLSSVVAIFAWQNPEIVILHFLKMEFRGSLALVALLFFVGGFLTFFLVNIPSWVKMQWTLRKQRKKIKDLEDEIADADKRPILDKQAQID